MTLSCDCDTEDRWYYESDDYTILTTSKRKRCASCNSLIDISAICALFTRYRATKTDIEEKIYGEEIRLADAYMCECCSDLYFSITELGYCVDLSDNMHDLVREYRDMVNDPDQQEV